MIEKEFIPYEQALALKELGFDEPCFRVYDTLGFVQDEKIMDELSLEKIQSPTFSQAFRWFREQYNINGLQFINQTLGGGYALSSMEEHDQVDGYFEAYEEAELACLNKLIEIVKNK